MVNRGGRTKPAKKRGVVRFASIGLRVKTGRAIAVVLEGPVESPSLWKRQELILADFRTQATWQPYHPVMDLPWEEAEIAVRKTALAIHAAARRALGELVRQVSAAGLKLCGVGVVGGSALDPARIGNPHIRAHAAEGRLYRKALETAAQARRVSASFFTERNVYEGAARVLKRGTATLKGSVSGLGGKAVRPWRADEKAAALAAWIVLALAGGPQTSHN